jgi:hypothetical protein
MKNTIKLLSDSMVLIDKGDAFFRLPDTQKDGQIDRR